LSVKEELLFCKPLLGSTTSNDILKKSDQFMKVHGIEWKKKCVRVCSDGARAKTGNTVALLPKLKKLFLMVNLLTVAFIDKL
jgi:hypothetical protein